MSSSALSLSRETHSRRPESLYLGEACGEQEQGLGEFAGEQAGGYAENAVVAVCLAAEVLVGHCTAVPG